ncbi:MAG: hypothetical protein JXX29_21935 [Deltaproteobacteria bacterium]|nr:hypothetical protein [Deltaproteobacteria bacterium]MBN2674356.1 hypothetical protein [Deltaproteobacteria bacterium]
MIRFLIDQFRSAPGPLKKPRILVADLAEEVLDLAKHYLGKDDPAAPTGYTDSAPPPSTEPVEAQSAPTPPTSEANTAAVSEDAPESTAGLAAGIDPKLAKAISVSGNARKQAFKVLAILWDANQKNLGALSAKAISKHGEEVLNLQIRHENVRKVIRMRLENYVNVHAQGVGNGTVYNYEMSEAGLNYFASTYFN